MRVAVLLLAGLGALSTDDPEPAALPRSGPLAGILDPRVKAAPVTDGLAFAISVLADGRVASGVIFRLPIGEQRLTLQFESLEMREDGTLEAVARIRNESDRPVHGLRLDFTARATIGSPLWFGDVPPRSDAQPVAFRTTPIVRDPASPVTIVMGVVSGYAFLGAEAPPARPAAPVVRGKRTPGPTPRALPVATPCTIPATLPREGGFGSPGIAAECSSAGPLRFVLERSSPARVQVFDSEFRFVTSFGEASLPAAPKLEVRGERDIVVQGAESVPPVLFRRL